MYKTYLHKAIETVPGYGDRISLFTKKLRLAQYADSTIYSYRLKISQAVLYLKKLPDDFTQADVDDYLTMLLDRNCYSLSFFKHTVFGLKDYYKYMGLKEPGGLVLPRVRKPKRLPRVLSQEQMKRLIGLCELYDKALLSTIYDCALRVSEVCSLKWIDISFDRQQVFVYQGNVSRICPLTHASGVKLSNSTIHSKFWHDWFFIEGKQYLSKRANLCSSHFFDLTLPPSLSLFHNSKLNRVRIKCCTSFLLSLIKLNSYKYPFFFLQHQCHSFQNGDHSTSEG